MLPRSQGAAGPTGATLAGERLPQLLRRPNGCRLVGVPAVALDEREPSVARVECAGLTAHVVESGETVHPDQPEGRPPPPLTGWWLLWVDTRRRWRSPWYPSVVVLPIGACVGVHIALRPMHGSHHLTLLMACPPLPGAPMLSCATQGYTSSRKSGDGSKQSVGTGADQQVRW